MVAAILIAALTLGGCATVSAPPPGAVSAATAPSHQQAKAAAVVRTARSLVGAPYAWGGSSPTTGFDCSGLVWYTYHQNGVTLPRMSWQQYGAGSAVSAEELRPATLSSIRSRPRQIPARGHRHRPRHLCPRPQHRQAGHGIHRLRHLLGQALHRRPPRTGSRLAIHGKRPGITANLRGLTKSALAGCSVSKRQTGHCCCVRSPGKAGGLSLRTAQGGFMNRLKADPDCSCHSGQPCGYSRRHPFGETRHPRKRQHRHDRRGDAENNSPISRTLWVPRQSRGVSHWTNEKYPL